MKTLKLLRIIFLLSVILCATACADSKDNVDNTNGMDDNPKVTVLTSPAEGTEVNVKYVDELTLIWEEASCDCDFFVQYEVLFSTVRNFDSPFLTLPSDNEGDAPKLTLTSDMLDGILQRLGVDSREFLTVYWTVSTTNLSNDESVISDQSSNFKLNLKGMKYVNPLTASKCADPSIFKGDDGYWYAFGTGARLVRYRSADLVEWEQLTPPFTVAGKPDHVEGATGVWAPDLEYINGQYVLYYSQNATMEGGNPNSSVGVAIGSSLSGNFNDLGVMIQAKDFNTPGGCIDQFYWEENGKKYLGLGSFKGIYLFELNDDGLTIKDKTNPVKLAGNAYEGGMLYKRGEYYYLFASIGNCCNGKDSSYQLVVGRSKNLFGPYGNMKSEKMLDNKHRLLLSSNERFRGPGHCSEIFEDSNGDIWVMYHAFDMEENNGEPTSRKLMMDKIIIGPLGWPNINDGYPSEGGDAPVFR